MKRSITIAGVRFRGKSLLLIFFCCSYCACRQYPVWEMPTPCTYTLHRPGTFVLLPACAFRHRRPVHCAKYRRRTSLPCLRTLHPQTEMEPYPAERCKISSMGVRMVLSGMGTELLAKNFYERTRIPYTAYTPDNFRSFTDSYIENLNRLLHRYYVGRKRAGLP